MSIIEKAVERLEQLQRASAAPVEGRADIAEVRFGHHIDIRVTGAEVSK